MDNHVYSPADKSTPHVSGMKRRRAALACTCCRRRKIRCDAGQPTCGNCSKAGLSCVYDDSKRRRTQRMSAEPDPSGSDVSISRRLQRLESLLTTLLERQEGGSIDQGNYSDRGDQSSESSDDASMSENEDASDDQQNDKTREGSNKHETMRKLGSHDLFNLIDRRTIVPPDDQRPSEFEPFVMYSHGVTTAVLTPACMRWLCARIGNPEIGREAERLLVWIWKRLERVFWDQPDRAQEAPGLDVNFVRYCLEQFRKGESMSLKAILSEDEVDFAIKSCNGDLKLTSLNMSSPYSLVFPIIVMWATKDVRYMPGSFGPYSREQAAEHNRLAYVHGLRIASTYFMAESTMLVLRLLTSFLHMMTQRARLSQLRSLAAVAIGMSNMLGLPREETSRNISPEESKRRKVLWAATQSFDYTLSLQLFQQPMLDAQESFSLIHSPWDPKDDLWPLRQRREIFEIYTRVYRKVFSSSARNTSVRRVLKHIFKCDNRLVRWKEGLPAEIKEPLAVAKELARLQSITVDERGRPYEPYELLDRLNVHVNMVHTFVCYYHILILIHSIPALTPSSLTSLRDEPSGVPARLQDSLQIISESARILLGILWHGKAAFTEALTMYLASNAICVLFLKHIREPRHPTNAADLLLLYRFVIQFRDLTSEPISTISSEVGQCVVGAWLILTSALTRLNHQYQPLLPKSTQDELHSAEKEASKGFTNPFAGAQSRTEQQKRDSTPSGQSSKPQNTNYHGTPDPQVGSVQLFHQFANFHTSAVRSPQPQSQLPRHVMQVPPHIHNQQPPPQVALGSPLVQPPSTQGQLARMISPQLQSPPQSSGIQGPLPVQQFPQLTPPHNPIIAQMAAQVPAELTKTEADLSDRWTPMGAINDAPPSQSSTTYLSPSEENSLWDAFSLVTHNQDSVFQQANMQQQIPCGDGDMIDECVIA